MTPEAQRIAIGTAVGLLDCKLERWCGYGQLLQPTYQGKGQGDFRLIIPNYLNDLNAIRAAEESLSEDQQVVFAWNLLKVTGYDTPDFTLAHARHVWNCAHATADQRSEAFLRTLNLWKD